MTGHHIYTRSWFELGSKSKNPGTFTVELTDDIFGAQSNDVIYGKLNPMLAAVPEALAPLNSGKSMLRIFHPLPDTTVVSRNWFVTDEITGRGPVPYAHSLIFRRNTNDVFLKNPAHAFSLDSAEQYESFLARVTPDEPVALSRRYDPRKEDYMSPFIFGKSDWIESFGFNQALFVKYFVSLCKAICDKGNLKLAVVLPNAVDSELLILATLALLPMFMKRRFGAASSWKGMMDGSSSKAVSGLHLVCCYENYPMSDSKLPILDLTEADRSSHLDVAEQGYANCVWDNLGDSEMMAEFEGFLLENFSSVLEKMPYRVIDSCFMLWNVFVKSKAVVDFRLAAIITKLITDCFAKNFAKFPFIVEKIKFCLSIIQAGLASPLNADLDTAVIQAICLLAGNGEDNARNSIISIHDHYHKKGDFKRAAITASYYAGLLEQPGITAEIEALCCKALLECASYADHGDAKAAQGALGKYFSRLKAVMLNFDTLNEKADELFARYSDAALALHSSTGGKLSGAFFQLPELAGATSYEVSARFVRLMTFDIKQLGHSPTPAQWIDTFGWVKPLARDKDGQEQIKEIYKLYYNRVTPDKRRACVLHIEKHLREILNILLLSDSGIRHEIEQVFIECCLEGFQTTQYTMNTDEVWDYVRQWLDRLAALGFKDGDTVRKMLRQALPIDRDGLLFISGSISHGSLKTVEELYGGSNVFLGSTLGILFAIDDVAASRAVPHNASGAGLIQVPEINNYLGRMNYWYDKSFNDPSEWALLMMIATVGVDGFHADKFLSLCRSKTGVTSNAIGPEDMACIFKAISKLNGYGDAYRVGILSKLKSVITPAIDSHNAESVFSNSSVMGAFSGIEQSPWKYEIGRAIVYSLSKHKEVDPEMRDVYFQYRFRGAAQAGPDPKPVVYFALLSILLAALAGFSVFWFGAGIIGSVIGALIPTWVPYLLAGLVLLSTAFNAVMNLSKK